MTVDWMRMKLKKESVYTSPTWICKVDKMSDSQVIAVYHKFLNSGKFKPKARRNEPRYEQMTIFDYI